MSFTPITPRESSAFEVPGPKRRFSARLRDLTGKETRRFFKFLIVGGVAFAVDTGCLTAFVLFFSIDRTLAKALSFSIAVLTSFIGNHYWTYQESRSKPLAKKLIQFGCVSLSGLGVNLAVFSIVQGAASKTWGPVAGLYIGQFVAVGASMTWNFFANRFVTYRDVR